MGGLDYQLEEDGILIGNEPAYQYEHLDVLFLCQDKNKSYREKGIAWGSYGSDIAKTRRYYSDYKYKTKFTKFVDRWHNLIFNK